MLLHELYEELSLSEEKKLFIAAYIKLYPFNIILDNILIILYYVKHNYS